VKLGRRFVEKIVQEALEARRASDPAGLASVVDWEALWAKARGAASLEQALGKVLLGADAFARDVRRGPLPLEGERPDRAQLVHEPVVDLSPGQGPVPDIALFVDAPRPAEPSIVELPPVPESPHAAVAEPSLDVPLDVIRLEPDRLAEAAANALDGLPIDTPRAPETPIAASVPSDVVWCEPPAPAIVSPPLGTPAPWEEAPLPASGGEPREPETPSWRRLLAVRVATRSTPEPRGSERSRKRRRLATVFGWVQFTGVLLCLFVAWQLWGTGITNAHEQAALNEQFTAHLPAGPQKVAAPALIPANATVPIPAEGNPVARLQIPAIGLDKIVVEGTAEGDLAKGPGHYVGTAMPGQAGNVSIAGHRTTNGAPFYNLGNLVPGDVIILTTDTGVQLKYIESQAPVPVAPSDVAVLNSFGDNRLTLTTCNPKYSAAQRLVAVALLQTPVANPAPDAAQGKTVHRKVDAALAASSAGWHLSSLPEVLLCLLLMAVLGVANNRGTLFLGRNLRWLILGPLWGGVIYLLFESLTNLLPAAI
jgi:sortase A